MLASAFGAWDRLRRSRRRVLAPSHDTFGCMREPECQGGDVPGCRCRAKPDARARPLRCPLLSESGLSIPRRGYERYSLASSRVEEAGQPRASNDPARVGS